MSKSKFSKEDLLPDFDTHKLETQDPAYLYATEEMFARYHGCVKLLGPIEICYDIDLSRLKARVCLVIAGSEYSCIDFDPGSSHTLRGQIDDVAKAEITIAFEQNTLRAVGKLCIKTIPYETGWRCKTIEVILLQW
jgi:hypothetical protein